MTADKREELLMKAKPILFNTEMVRAILDGRKTVTRRLVKPQPPANTDDVYFNYIKNGMARWGWENSSALCDRKLPYQSGDILYVRETWAPFYETMYSVPVIGYRYYSETDEEIKERLPEYLNWFWPGRWYPSIHMPREAARIFLKVTNVRVERLQDIDDDGVISEGMEIGAPFDDLWDSTVKKKDLDRYGWDADPWVWVVEFERIN